MCESKPYVVNCPGCRTSLGLFQTTDMIGRVQTYMQGDCISTPLLKVLKGTITLYDYCEVCHKMLYLMVDIDQGKLGKVIDMELRDK